MKLKDRAKKLNIEIPALIALTIRLIPADIMERCREQASYLWEKGKPKKWYYAIPFILIWILVVLIILYAFLF